MDNKYQHRTHCVLNIGYHIIRCTKYRKKILYGKVEHTLKRLLREQASILGLDIGAMEVMPDHVHLFVHCGQNGCPAHLTARLKGVTARRLLQEFPSLNHKRSHAALWGSSYFCESVGHISQDTVRRYVDNQKNKGLSSPA